MPPAAGAPAQEPPHVRGFRHTQAALRRPAQRRRILVAALCARGPPAVGDAQAGGRAAAFQPRSRCHAQRAGGRGRGLRGDQRPVAPGPAGRTAAGHGAGPADRPAGLARAARTGALQRTRRVPLARSGTGIPFARRLLPAARRRVRRRAQRSTPGQLAGRPRPDQQRAALPQQQRRRVAPGPALRLPAPQRHRLRRPGQPDPQPRWRPPRPAGRRRGDRAPGPDRRRAAGRRPGPATAAGAQRAERPTRPAADAGPDDPATARIHRPPAGAGPHPRRRAQLRRHQLRQGQRLRPAAIRLQPAQRDLRPADSRGTGQLRP